MIRRAITLIETLTTLAIVVVLTLLSVIALRGVITSSRDVKDLSNLAHTGRDFAAWAADHDDTMPNAGLPDAPSASWFLGQRAGFHAYSRYLSQDVLWPQLLERSFGRSCECWHSSYGPNTMNGQIDVSRYGPERYWRLPTSYVYSRTMLTSADLWRSEGVDPITHEQVLEHFRVVSRTRIKHPGAKGVLLHRERPIAPIVWHVAFADGSASARSPVDARPAAVPPRSATRRPGTPVLHTIQGFEGLDF